MGSQLSDEDRWKFLLHLYFGPVRDPVRKAIDRAYRDFNRTLHGFAEFSDGASVKAAAGQHLRESLGAFADTKFGGQPDFDSWHSGVCSQIKAFYADAGFPFTVGQAQKWLNMSIKYLFLLDRSKVDANWQYCHIPLDNIVVRNLRSLGHTPPTLGSAWSRVDSYDRYLEFQTWFRDTISGVPMDNEFRIWKGP